MNENNIIENNAEELESAKAAVTGATDSAPATEESVADEATEASVGAEAADAVELSPEEVAAIAEAEEQKAKSKEAELAALQGFNWKKFWDKITTGLLVFLLSSPFLVLIYIVLWFTVLR
ncbi:MAG: hypothetical protein IJX38_05220 [Clostridia bacterium]|nr:hypothetical protein [Clostridia bacterium]